MHLTGLLAAVVLLLAAGPSAAQYASKPVDAALARKGTTLRSLLRQPLTAPADKQLFQDYFLKYHFPAMTQATPEGLAELGTLRSELFSRYVWPAQPGEQAQLTKWAQAFADEVVRGRYHPAVKYNAVVLLGMLDKEYANDAAPSPGKPAPLPEATKFLCRVVDVSVQRQSLPAYMQVGAMVGLVRHAKHLSALPGDAQRALATTLLAAAKQEKFPADASRPVRDWMKVQAAQGIANLGVPGKDGVFVDTLMGVVASPDLSLENRCRVAALLTQIKLDGLPAGAAGRGAETLQQLACAVAQHEDRVGKEYEEVQRLQRRTPGQEEFVGRIRYDELEQRFVYERAPLVTLLHQLRAGVTALAKPAGAQGEKLTAIEGALTTAIEAGTDDRTIDLNLVKAVRTMASEVTQVAGCKPQAAPPTEEDDLLGSAR